MANRVGPWEPPKAPAGRWLPATSERPPRWAAANASGGSRPCSPRRSWEPIRAPNESAAAARYAEISLQLAPGDNVVSFLPLAHAFGCSFDFLAPMAAGCHVTYVEKIPTPKVLVAAFEKYKPVYVMSVPLVIEKIFRNRKPVKFG